MLLGRQARPRACPADYLCTEQQPHLSQDSHLINATLALGSQCSTLSRAWAFTAALRGLPRAALRVSFGHNVPGDAQLARWKYPLDFFSLPGDLLLEAAAQDLGKDYAAQLRYARLLALAFRLYAPAAL